MANGQGLPVSDIANVTVSLQAAAVGTRNFGAALLIGQSNVIDISERIREYSSIEAVGADFGGSSGEYLAARNYFAQEPKPASVQIGRWAQGAVAAVLKGGTLSAAQQLPAAWTSITTGSMQLTIDGVLKTLSALSFASVTNMNAVAAVIDTALGVTSDCVWNSVYQRLEITSATTGATSTITVVSPTGSGVDISVLTHLTTATGATAVQGAAAEAYLSAVIALMLKSNGWYGAYGAALSAANADHVAAAGIIEAATTTRIYGATTQEAGALSSASTTDLAYLFKAQNFGRSFVQYSSTDAYAGVSIYGRAFTVDFTGFNTTLTLKFKVEPGIAAETINTTQAAVLKSKNCNVFVNYDNGAAIIQEGVMSNGDFFDERQGLDWLQNQIQTDLFNLFYGSETKIPQTDAGGNQIVTTVSGSLDKAVNNGLVAPGVWTGGPLGVVKAGQTLSTGYYVTIGTMAAQSAGDRAARKAPLCQAIAKLAGAVHYANVALNVVR